MAIRWVNGAYPPYQVWHLLGLANGNEAKYHHGWNRGPSPTHSAWKCARFLSGNCWVVLRLRPFSATYLGRSQYPLTAMALANSWKTVVILISQSYPGISHPEGCRSSAWCMHSPTWPNWTSHSPYAEVRSTNQRKCLAEWVPRACHLGCLFVAQARRCLATVSGASPYSAVMHIEASR